jgi:hypothetical protein
MTKNTYQKDHSATCFLLRVFPVKDKPTG